MTDLKVRRMRFDFTEPVALVWNPSNIRFSHAINLASIIAICFEKMIVEAVHEAKPCLADTPVADEAIAFLRQEAQHANAHRQHVSALINRYPGLQSVLDSILAAYDELTETTPLAFRLAYIANLEATFTPTFKCLLDHEDKLFAPGDDRVASLLLWHLVEEVEHRNSALVIYDTVVGDKMYRLRTLPAMIRHIKRLVPHYAEGVKLHVPANEHGLDLIESGDGSRIHLSNRGSGASQDEPTNGTGKILAGVPLRDKLTAVRGLMRSQSPWFSPIDENLPDFADYWFARYERGDDVTHWYGSQRVAD